MIIALLLAALTGCGEVATPDKDGELRLLTYNVHGLLPAITGDDTPARMQAISPKLASFDVVAIQENFFHSDELMGEAPHAHAAHFHEVGEGRSAHSGLSILSVVPIVRQEGRPWEQCHGLFDGASDCLGTKGVFFVRLQVGAAATVDLYDLHMEAGGGAEDIAARTSNVEQLLAFMAERSGPDRAVIVAGDFNLRPSDPDDEPLLARLVEASGLQEACALVGCPELDHIDRFYVRSGDHLGVEITQWHREREFVDESGGDLSDHPALSVGIRWQTR